MNILEDCLYIVKDILSSKRTILSVMKEYFNINLREGVYKNNVENIVNHFFKNYYLYLNLVHENLNKVNNALIAGVGISLSANKLKIISTEDCVNYLTNFLKNNKEEINKDLINSFEDNYHFKNIKMGSIDYLSIKLNLPVWFIRLIIKQRSNEEAKAILNSFRGKKVIKEASYLFDEERKYRDYSFYDNLFNNFVKYNNQYVTLFIGNTSDFYLNFLNKYYEKENIISIACKSMFNNKDLFKDTVSKKLNNVYVYECNESQLIARLDNKQDVLFYLPETSNMNLFYNNKDYLVNFDTTILDNLVADEMIGLDNLKDYIDVNGTLIYLSSTLNKKENEFVVKDFLNKNKDFILVEERNILPSKEENVLGYYAVLRKVTHEN